MQRNEYCSLASVKLMLSVAVLLPVMPEFTHLPLAVRYCHWYVSPSPVASTVKLALSPILPT